MNGIIHYFETIPSLHRALILAGGITFFWLLESGIPLFRFKYNKWKHAGVNFFFTFTTIIINFGFAVLIVLSQSFWFAAMDKHAFMASDDNRFTITRSCWSIYYSFNTTQNKMDVEVPHGAPCRYIC
jgi:hypothetical protein